MTFRLPNTAQPFSVPQTPVAPPPGLAALIPSGAQPAQLQQAAPPQASPFPQTAPQPAYQQPTYQQGQGFPQVPMQNGGAQQIGSDIFNPMAAAQAQALTPRLPYFQPGHYRVEIVRSLVTKVNPSFVVEFKVLESTNPAIQPGGMHVWIQGLNSPYIWPRVIKSFFMAVIGVTSEAQLAEKGVTDAVLAELMKAAGDPNTKVSETFDPNPLKGSRVDAVGTAKQVFNKTTKQSETRTALVFMPYSGH